MPASGRVRGRACIHKLNRHRPGQSRNHSHRQLDPALTSQHMEHGASALVLLGQLGQAERPESPFRLDQVANRSWVHGSTVTGWGQCPCACASPGLDGTRLWRGGGCIPGCDPKSSQPRTECNSEHVKDQPAASTCHSSDGVEQARGRYSSDHAVARKARNTADVPRGNGRKRQQQQSLRPPLAWTSPEHGSVISMTSADPTSQGPGGSAGRRLRTRATRNTAHRPQ